MAGLPISPFIERAPGSAGIAIDNEVGHITWRLDKAWDGMLGKAVSGDNSRI
jgi:hypothetical protein